MDKYLTVFCTFIEVLRSEYLKSKLCWEVQDIWSSWLWGFDSFHRFISPLCILPSPQNRGAINLFHNSLLRIYFFFGTVQFSHSVVSDSLWPMDCSTLGFPVHHRLLKPTQTHLHCIGDAIQPSHPLLSHSPALNLSQHQGLFKWVSSLR